MLNKMGCNSWHAYRFNKARDIVAEKYWLVKFFIMNKELRKQQAKY